MKKRVLALCLAALMLMALLAGCGGSGGAASSGGASSGADGSQPASSGGGSADEIKIGFTMAVRDQFLTSMELAATAYAEAQPGVTIDVVDANNDVALQISHVQTWASSGFDAAIICAVSNDTAPELIQAAGDMKVVFVNRQPELSLLNENIVYVGTDETLYGKEQAKFLAEYFKAQGKTDINVILFQGVLGLDNVIKRTQSVKDGLTENGINYNIVYEDTANWDRAEAMNKFVQIMGDSSKQYDVVISNNDEMALGVIEAMLTTGEQKVLCPVVGIDATSVGCEAIERGEMACSVFQDPVAQGEGAAKCAIALVKGEEIEGLVDNYYNIVPQLVTKDNVADFM